MNDEEDECAVSWKAVVMWVVIALILIGKAWVP